MSRIVTIFFDVGGVCLTNGWDTGARQSAARHFSLDVEELERRHQALADALERGEQSLDGYLDRVVFHRYRSFSRDAFTRFMQEQSQPLGSALGLIRHLASAGSYTLATINNESRELNRYRIDTFRLSDIFSAFFSSCYLGVRKPDARIYEIALDVMQAEPATSLFVDDREENVEGARALGLHTIHVTDPRSLARQLLSAGVEVPASALVPARMCTDTGAGK
ncbi:MAG: HAD family hydrolase [Vicinamibacterales bacterium]